MTVEQRLEKIEERRLEVSQNWPPEPSAPLVDLLHRDIPWLLSLVRSLLPVVEAERARKLIDTYREVLRRRDAGEIIDVANDTPTIRRLDAALHAYRESDK